MMLFKERSHKMAIVKYGFIAPLFLGLLIIASACTESNSNKAGPKESDPEEINIDANEIVISALKRDEEIDGNSFVTPEISPEFPGGSNMMYQFLMENIKYPKVAIDAGISGKVYAKFEINKDGSVGKGKIIKGIGYGTEEEVLRLISKMPKWKPGTLNGEAVSTYFTMPFNFV